MADSRTNRTMLMRALVLGAVKEAAKTQKKPLEILEDLVLGHYQTSARNGRTVISTTEAGGTTVFALLADLSPAEVMALAMEAIAFCKSQPDPDNPNPYPRRTMRLRASFRRARI